VNEIGREAIQNRLTALPGRSMQDLVNAEPGWLYEGNAVLHPRGSEYQTQFVVDGIPLTDNRSPSFGPESADGDELNRLKIYTAGIPAEYGRKMGGVMKSTRSKIQPLGCHGQFTVFGGTYATGGIDTQDQYTWKHNTFGVSAAGNMTGHYLNRGSTELHQQRHHGQFFSELRARPDAERPPTLIVRHDLARYDIPTNSCSKMAPTFPTPTTMSAARRSRRQTSRTIAFSFRADNCRPATTSRPWAAPPTSIFFLPTRSAGCASWPRQFQRLLFQSSVVAVIATQHNDFKEIYFSGSGSVHYGNQEWKAGVESDAIFLNEDFAASFQIAQTPQTLGVRSRWDSGRGRTNLLLHRKPA